MLLGAIGSKNNIPFAGIAGWALMISGAVVLIVAVTVGRRLT
jgi:hypothetical protein